MILNVVQINERIFNHTITKNVCDKVEPTRGNMNTQRRSKYITKKNDCVLKIAREKIQINKRNHFDELFSFLFRFSFVESNVMETNKVVELPRYALDQTVAHKMLYLSTSMVVSLH